MSMRASLARIIPALLAGTLSVAGFTAADAQGPRTAAMPTSWIQLRGGTDNTGSLPGTIETSWNYKSVRPVRGIAVADGLVVLGTESADADAAPGDFADDQRGFVTALDATTGHLRWTHPVPTWIHGDPVIFHGRVVATYGRWPMTHPGGATAYDARSGRALWSFVAEAGMMPGAAVDTIANQVLVAGADGILYAFDAVTGTVLHRSGLASADAMSSPHIDRSQVLFLGGASTVNSYSARSHERRWTYRPPDLGDLGDVPVALTDSIVFITGTRHLGVWHAASALPLTRFVALAREAHRTRHLKSYQAWFREQWLLAVRRDDGRLLWQRPLGVGLEVPRNTSGTPVVTGERVIVSSPVSRTVWAFDVASGAVLWNRRLPATHKGAVTIVGSDILAGDKNGNLMLLGLADGKVLGQCATGSSFTPTAPVVVGRTLIAATKDGWVHATPYDSLRRRAVQGGAKCF